MKLWAIITLALLGSAVSARGKLQKRVFPRTTLRPEAFWNASNGPLAFTSAVIFLATGWAFIHHYIIFRRQQNQQASTGKGRNVDLLDEFVLRQIDNIASMDKSYCLARLVCKVSCGTSSEVTDSERPIIAFLKSMDNGGSKNLRLVEASLAKSCDGIGASCPFNVEYLASIF